jgi:hypothetical protein
MGCCKKCGSCKVANKQIKPFTKEKKINALESAMKFANLEREKNNVWMQTQCPNQFGTTTDESTKNS